MTSAYENAMSDTAANNYTQKYPIKFDDIDMSLYESRIAQLEAERDELLRRLNITTDALNTANAQCSETSRKLEQAQRAMSLADVDSIEKLGDWIVGAQSELANLSRDNERLQEVILGLSNRLSEVVA